MKRLMASLLLCVVGLATIVAAQAPDELKARFRERLPAIDRLKADGVVGENNQGFLEFVGSEHKDSRLVKAENADRRKLYEAIAASTGTTAALVGQRRALQIAAEAASGVMLQDAKGNWSRKP